MGRPFTLLYREMLTQVLSDVLEPNDRVALFGDFLKRLLNFAGLKAQAMETHLEDREINLVAWNASDLGFVRSLGNPVFVSGKMAFGFLAPSVLETFGAKLSQRGVTTGFLFTLGESPEVTYNLARSYLKDRLRILVFDRKDLEAMQSWGDFPSLIDSKLRDLLLPKEAATR